MFNKNDHGQRLSRWKQPYGIFALSLTSGLLSYRLSLHGWCCIFYALRISSNRKFNMNYIAASVTTPIAVVSSAFVSSHMAIQCYKRYINDEICYLNYPKIFKLNYQSLSIYHWNSDFHKFLLISSIVSFSTFRCIQLLRSNVGFTIFDIFRVLTPSDLWCRGSYARYCINKNVYRRHYATEYQKKLIEEYGMKYGCHHCGRKQFMSSKFKTVTKPMRRFLNKYFSLNISLTEYIADHIPPSKVLKLKRKRQVFLPQCRLCCMKQANSVKSKRRTL
eukprot:42126_1